MNSAKPLHVCIWKASGCIDIYHIHMPLYPVSQCVLDSYFPEVNTQGRFHEGHAEAEIGGQSMKTPVRRLE